MRTILAVYALFALGGVHAQERGWPRWERLVGSASELQVLCREEAQAHYIRRGKAVYQWTGSYHDYADTLYADGRLRVDGRDVEVHCRIPRNAREGYLAIELVEPE